jgi:hypothetical protein
MEGEGPLERIQQEYTNIHQQYTNIMIASLLNAHIATINSERQVIWRLFTAMMLANALLYGFFLQLEAPTRLQVIFAVGLGGALCMAWLILTISSFRLFMLQLDAAGGFARFQLAQISKYANPALIEEEFDPLIIGIEWRRTRRIYWIFYTMLFVIILFIVAYALWLVHHLYYIFIFNEGPP